MEMNIVYNEDCLKTMERMEEKSVNIILTSPPYNMTKRKGGYADKQPRYDVYVDWRSEEEYVDWTVNIFKSFDKILSKDGVILYNFSYSTENPALPYKMICGLLNETDFTLADTIVWKKSNSIPHPASYNRLNRCYEFIYVICRKNELTTFQCNKKVVKVSPKNQKYYEIVDNMIFAKNNDGSNPLNKATFSTDMVNQLLNIYSREGDVVYDPFTGTGTTAICCIKKNITFIGSEISKNQIDYFNQWKEKIGTLFL
jgi:site-specific DNA-methyltransferase (adenine-specific)/modification methylase